MTTDSAAIEALVKPYSEMDHLESDGLSRVLHHVLTLHGIPNVLWSGSVTNRTTGTGLSVHFWIDLPGLGKYIDYRVRGWLAGEDVPHGIFDPADYPNMDYQRSGAGPAGVLPPAVLEMLLLPGPKPIAEITMASLSEGASAVLDRYQLAHDGQAERLLPLPRGSLAMPVPQTQELILFLPKGDLLVLDSTSQRLVTSDERGPITANS